MIFILSVIPNPRDSITVTDNNKCRWISSCNCLTFRKYTIFISSKPTIFRKYFECCNIHSWN